MTYLLIRGVSIYKNNPRREIVVYYSLGLGLPIIGMVAYCFTPFLVEGQDFYAELTLGTSLVVMQVGILCFVQYWHTISREVPVISKLFFLTAGASLMVVLISPDLWEIYYVPELGYHQNLSILYSAILALVILLSILILFDNLNRVRQVIDRELKLVENGKLEILKAGDPLNKDLLMQQTRILNNEKRLHENKRSINMISLFWVIGLLCLILGIVLPGRKALNTDSIGLMLIFIPQAYYYTKDKRLMNLLIVQKVQNRAKRFQESFSELDKEISKEIPRENIQALIEFIEKADALLYQQESHG